MDIKHIKKTINGSEYAVVKFGALKSIRLASKLSKMLEDKIRTDDLGEADIMKTCLALLGDDKFESVVQELCTGLTVNGLSVDFDTYFRDAEKDLLPVVVWTLKGNVLPFFDLNALTTLLEEIPQAPQ